jgi:hypothetical protein
MSNQPQQKKSSPLRPVDPGQYSFDIGLVKITTNKGQRKRQKLPESTEIAPSVGRMEQRLRAIVDLQTFESILLEVLQPDVKTRTLLIPVHFRRRMGELRESIRGELEKKNKAQADIDELLGKLETQLAEETGRNELLDQYRLMILMG